MELPAHTVMRAHTVNSAIIDNHGHVWNTRRNSYTLQTQGGFQMSGSDQSHKKTRAAQLPFNVASAARQSLLIGSGFSREDLSKPMVGIIVQQAQKIHPGQSHLSELAAAAAQGVREAGGTPVEINIGGFCDGVILPNPVYTFAHRNLLANMIEVAAEANLMDALLLLASCDKNVPAAVMGAARTNLPSIRWT